jgi:hypothetical protein
VLWFRPSCVGRGAVIHAGKRLGKLEALRAHYDGKQTFAPLIANFLLRYFADAAAYSADINNSWRPLPCFIEDTKLRMLGRNRRNQLILSEESIIQATVAEKVQFCFGLRSRCPCCLELTERSPLYQVFEEQTAHAISAHAQCACLLSLQMGSVN